MSMDMRLSRIVLGVLALAETFKPQNFYGVLVAKILMFNTCKHAIAPATRGALLARGIFCLKV